jgi:hypothetical protein
MIYCLLASLNLLPKSNYTYIKLSTVFSAGIGQFLSELCSHWLQEKQTAFWKFFILKIVASGPEIIKMGDVKSLTSMQYIKHRTFSLTSAKYVKIIGKKLLIS